MSSDSVPNSTSSTLPIDTGSSLVSGPTKVTKATDEKITAENLCIIEKTVCIPVQIEDGIGLVPLDLDSMIDLLDPSAIKFIEEKVTKIVIIKSQSYLTDATFSFLLRFTPTNKKVTDGLSLCDAQMGQIPNHMQPVSNIVPEELQDHYCLIFQGEIIFSTKDYNEFQKEKTEAVGICFTEYIPTGK